MNSTSDLIDTGGTANPTRRMLLAGMLSGYAASLIPWALAQPITDANLGAFVAVSAILAGRKALNEAQARRLYDALAADDPGFPAAASALLALMDARKIDPLQLQEVLDAEHAALAPLPRRIVTAWYLGIVGEGERARVVAFETALNAVAVADVLKPPTYCYGVYGSWTKKPA
ncbi:MAG TPA: sugar dehydrogenase complex small subunit [Burkholderiales bacterium]|nr:sugar dehydrogenase complex small subunit [Burkholderiales bacterium]